MKNQGEMIVGFEQYLSKVNLDELNTDQDLSDFYVINFMQYIHEIEKEEKQNEKRN